MIAREKTAKLPGDTFVKVVVDIDRNVLAYGCDLHADCAEELLQEGSKQKDLWGANLYPSTKEIEFISLINIRPQDGNRSMEIQLPEIRKKVEQVIENTFFSS